MQAFPPEIRVLFEGYGEDFDPAVDRTEMERGVPKQAIRNSGVLVKIRCSLLFTSEESEHGFRFWYFRNINRIDWFEMTHPRTGETIVARFEGGSIGPLSVLAPRPGNGFVSRRDVVIEYVDTGEYMGSA